MGITEDSSTLPFIILLLYSNLSSWRINVYIICEQKQVFAYFLLHFCQCLWIILDGSRNTPTFSQFLWQHYRKIKLQFAVIKLRKRERIAILAVDVNLNSEGRCIRTLQSYKKLKHLRIFAHGKLPCGISIGKKSELLLQCSQRSFISERSSVSEQWPLPFNLSLSGNIFRTCSAAQCSWMMMSHCQHGD